MNEQPAVEPTPSSSADDPPLQFNIAINDYGRIIVSFNKSVSWIGLDALSALDIANALVAHAVAVIKAPPRQQPPPTSTRPNGQGEDPLAS